MTKLFINTYLNFNGKYLKFKLSVFFSFLLTLGYYQSYSQTYEFFSEISGYTCVPSFVQFRTPYGIVAANDADYVFVSDITANKIHQFTEEGKFIRSYD